MKYQEILKTENMITLVKEFFSRELSEKLNLYKISSPLIVLDGTGINDDLNGTEKPVSFPIKSLPGKRAVVVHSLAKWKRLRLKELGLEPGKGIITDMRALRPDEVSTPLHSIYVDQWDWEKCIEKNQRTLSFLKNTVIEIYQVIKNTEKEVQNQYPDIKAVLPDNIKFIHAEELLQLYPFLNPKQREEEIAKKYGAVFIIGIGRKLSDGIAHDCRAADYDDWITQNESGYYGLNGDIILWHPVLKCAFEVSSMGIRVDKKALLKQLTEKGCLDKTNFSFHSMLLSGELPESIGGGIGQSRICMFMLKKKHIAEVQVSIWPDEEILKYAAEGLNFL